MNICLRVERNNSASSFYLLISEIAPEEYIFWFPYSVGSSSVKEVYLRIISFRMNPYLLIILSLNSLSFFLKGLILMISRTFRWNLNSRYSGKGLFWEKGMYSQSRFISLRNLSRRVFEFGLFFTRAITF